MSQNVKYLTVAEAGERYNNECIFTVLSLYLKIEFNPPVLFDKKCYPRVMRVIICLDSAAANVKMSSSLMLSDR